MKKKKNIKIRIPLYSPPRLDWRRRIHKEMMIACKENNIHYDNRDKIELLLILYMTRSQLLFHDVDNRLKDIMDALQGRIGGSKSRTNYPPIIPNDHQIYRVVVEKKYPPRQSRRFGHLVIKKYLG
jgi:hypothetical protein